MHKINVQAIAPKKGTNAIEAITQKMKYLKVAAGVMWSVFMDYMFQRKFRRRRRSLLWRFLTCRRRVSLRPVLRR